MDEIRKLAEAIKFENKTEEKLWMAFTILSIHVDAGLISKELYKSLMKYHFVEELDDTGAVIVDPKLKIRYVIDFITGSVTIRPWK